MGHRRFSRADVPAARNEAAVTPRVLLTRQADGDLSNIWDYVARDNIAAADKLTDDIHEMFQRLAVSPSLGFAQFQYRDKLRCNPFGGDT